MGNKQLIKKSSFLRGNELKTGLLTAKGSPYGFTPVEGINNTNEWINTDRLFALWRIGYCLGDLKPEAYTGKLQVYFKLSKENPVLLQLGQHGFAVCLANGTDFMSGGITMITLKNGLHVVWSNEVTCLQVDTFIADTHYTARMRGELIGNTLIFHEDIVEKVPEILNVVELFNMCSLAGPFPVEMEDKDILELFDQPILISVISAGGLKWVCLTAKKDEEQLRIDARLKELETSGVDINNIMNLDMTTLRDLCSPPEPQQN